MYQTLRTGIVILGICLATAGAVASEALQDVNPEVRVLANRLLTSADKTRGLCVQLGSGDGQLTSALASHSGLLVQGLSSDAAVAAQVRQFVDRQRVHGRVTIVVADFAALPYAENLVNLVIAPDLDARHNANETLDEIVRVLAPRGVGLLGGWAGQAEIQQAIAKLKQRGIQDVKTVSIDGTWLRLVKPVPVGVDDWTHLNHNAGGNRLSQDALAGPPTRLRWVDGPAWNTEANGPGAAVSIDGKLFYYFNEAPSGKPQRSWPAIYARDAHNGLLLWKRPVSGLVPLCFVATSKYVFSILERKGHLVALDRDTGKVAVNYTEATYPDWVIHHRGSLYMSAGARYSRRLMCIDAASGEVKWRSDREILPSGALPNFMVHGELGYYFDWRKKILGCIELETGNSRWEQPVDEFLTGSKWRYGLCSHGHGTLCIGEGMRGRGIHAFRETDGKHRWSHEYALVKSGRSARHKGSTYDGGFFLDGLYWTHVGQPRDERGTTRGALAWEGLDPDSGAVKRRFTYAADVVVGDSCHRAQATVNYFMGGHSRFVSTKTGVYAPRAYGIHNSCRFGMLPANGLTYTWSQYTNTYVRGVMGLTTANGESSPAAEPRTRLQTGQALGAVVKAVSGQHDWPCFAADASRSARSQAGISAREPAVQWTAKLESDVSPPVIAGGLAFIAQPDASRVVAIDTDSGEAAWTFLAGGRVSCPPTIHQGLCLFGCHDGWVYCLTASHGKLVWRFRAARRERLIVDRGRLASTWPVSGGVVIADGLACFVAGRHGTLDGGVDAYAVEPASGKLVWTRHTTAAPVVSLLAKGETSLGLSTKLALDPKTGERASRTPFSETVFRSDTINLTQRIGVKNDDPRTQPRLNVKAAAVVRDGDTILVAGQRGEAEPALVWQKQRNAQIASAEPQTPADQAPNGATRPQSEPPIGSYLWAFSIDDGRLLWSKPLPSAPVFDGVAVAAKNVYVATVGGKLLCLAAKPTTPGVNPSN